MACLEILLHADDKQAYITRKLIIAIAMWAKLYMDLHHSICAWKGSPCYLGRNRGWCYSRRYKDMLDTKQTSRIYGGNIQYNEW